MCHTPCALLFLTVVPHSCASSKHLQTRRFLDTLQGYLQDVQRTLIQLHQAANPHHEPFVDHAGVLRDSRTGRPINGRVSPEAAHDEFDDGDCMRECPRPTPCSRAVLTAGLQRATRSLTAATWSSSAAGSGLPPTTTPVCSFTPPVGCPTLMCFLSGKVISMAEYN